MAKNQKVGLEFEAKATGTGLKDTKKGLEDLGQAVDGAQFSISNLEKDVRSAEKKLKNTDLGAEGFEKLRIEIVKTKADLKKLKVGELDSKGIDALRTRVSKLKDKTRDAKVELSKPPKTSWADSVRNKFDELARAIPGGEKLSGFFGAISKGSKGSVLAVGALVTGLLSLGGIIRKGLGGIALFEDLEASFETLLGSASLAEQRLEEVREIAGSTPISVGDLATVSRQLETLTQGAFSSADALVLVGDAAAIAQKPGTTLGATMQELAVHVGRLFASLKSGSGEIGESTNRLSEMGLITPGVKERIRELHKEVGGGEEAWRLLQDALLKFEGEMLRRSDTISGAINNLGDAWDLFSSLIAKPIAPIYKASLQALGATMNSLSGIIEVTFDAYVRFFGGAGKETRKLQAEVEGAIKNAKSGFQSAEEAAKNGLENTIASVQELTSGLDDAVRKTKDLASQQTKLADLDLQIEFAEIDQDDSSTELEKLTAKQAAREANRQRVQQIQQDQREAEKKERGEPVRKIKNKIQAKTIELQDTEDAVDVLGSNKAFQERLSSAQRIEALNSKLADTKSEFRKHRDGPLAGAVDSLIRLVLPDSVETSIKKEFGAFDKVREERSAILKGQQAIEDETKKLKDLEGARVQMDAELAKVKAEFKELQNQLTLAQQDQAEGDRKQDEQDAFEDTVFSKKNKLENIESSKNIAKAKADAENKKEANARAQQKELNQAIKEDNRKKLDAQKNTVKDSQDRVSKTRERLVSILGDVLPKGSGGLIEDSVDAASDDLIMKSFMPGLIGQINNSGIEEKSLTIKQVRKLFEQLIRERGLLNEGEERLEQIEETIKINNPTGLDAIKNPAPEKFLQAGSSTAASSEVLTETIKQGGSDTTAALQQTQLAMQNSNARVVAVITGMTAAQADLASTLQELSTKVNSNIAQVSQIKSQVENNRRTA